MDPESPINSDLEDEESRDDSQMDADSENEPDDDANINNNNDINVDNPGIDENLNLIIGPYTILTKIPATTTYRCQNSQTGEMYICSIIPADRFAGFQAIYDRLKDHSGINQVSRIISQQDKNLVIYEHTYGDFHEYARNMNRTSQAEAAYFFHQIVTIVHDCQNLGIVVRDLKLRKFVFKDPERKKIVLETWDDSVLLDDPTNDCLSDKIGCPTYASPELINQSVTCYSGKNSASWSLGVILYALMTGRYPFYHRIPIQLLHRIERGFFNMPENISPSAATLIQNLISQDPNSRWTTSQILNSDWFRINNLHYVSLLTRPQPANSYLLNPSLPHPHTEPLEPPQLPPQQPPPQQLPPQQLPPQQLQPQPAPRRPSPQPHSSNRPPPQQSSSFSHQSDPDQTVPDCGSDS